MTEPESQHALTRQLAAECDMLRLRSAAHERTETAMRREIDELKESITYNLVTITNYKAATDDFREQIKQLKESLRLVGQLRRAEG